MRHSIQSPLVEYAKHERASDNHLVMPGTQMDLFFKRDPRRQLCREVVMYLTCLATPTYLGSTKVDRNGIEILRELYNIRRVERDIDRNRGGRQHRTRVLRATICRTNGNNALTGTEGNGIMPSAARYSQWPHRCCFVIVPLRRRRVRGGSKRWAARVRSDLTTF